jgi:hypothetical protein
MDRTNLALRRFLKRGAGALAIAIAIAIAPACFASGGDDESYDPLPRAVPTASMAQFAGGQLGVLDSSFQVGYLVVAWRVLARKPLSDAEVAMVHGALPGEPQNLDSSSWDAALQAAGAAPADMARNGEWSRRIDVTVDGQHTFTDFDNCNASTARTALDTLKARIEAHGAIASSPWVAEWVHGQAAVLSNCTEGATLPEPLGADAPEWLRKDRDYQRASALFYSMQYDKARDAFEAIAADKSSPWAEFGQYLAGRSMLRASSLSVTPEDHKRFAVDARKRFDVVARTGTPRVRMWALQLRARAAIEADPDTALAEAAATLDRADWGETGPMMLDTVMARGQTSASPHGNLPEWLSLVRQAPGSAPTLWTMPAPTKGQPAVDNSQPRRRACTLATASGSDNPAAWAVACLMFADQMSDVPAPVLAWVQKLPATHPAHATLGYYLFQARMRTLAHLADDQRPAAQLALRADIDRAVAGESALYGADGVNALRLLRVPLATDGAALLRDTRLQAVAGYVELYSWKHDEGRHVDDGTVDDALHAGIVDSMLSVNALARLSAEPGVEPAEAQRLLLKAWQRSVLLGQAERQKTLAAEVSRRAPQWRTAIAAMQAATTVAQSRYEWASLVYRRSAEFGGASEGMDKSTVAGGQPPALLAWLKPDEVAERAAEIGVKPTMPVESQTLGDAVIGWARSHPKDPRLAGDLASVVTQWKYSYHPQGTPQYVPQSREAFTLLHKLFPRSQEARDTRYFY